MNKKFEYVDDNPGSYFGMLIESVEDKKNFRNWIEKKVGKQMSNMKPTKIGYRHGRPYYSVDFVDGTSDDYFIDFDKKEIEKCESLKEDKKLNEQSKYLPTNSSGIVNLKKVIKELESKFTYLLKRRRNGESQIQIFPKGHVETNAFGQEYVDRIGLIGPDDETVILSLATDPNDEYCVLYRFPELDKKWKKARTVVELFNAIVYKVVNSTNESLKESVSKSDLYSALEYMYGFNKKEANDWIKKASNKMKQSVVDGWKGNAKKSALTDSLKEDKFVSRDKMSKKDRKELDSQKRNTWGNTNPVTRVQPNKKAYDRKRDSKVVDERLDSQSDFELTYVLDELEELSNYYKSRQDDWSKRDSEEFLKDMNDIIHRTQHLFRKAKVLGESKKLNESSDGWDESKLYDLSEILDEIYNLQYEVQNTVRGAYTNAHTYEELGYYVHNLGSNLMDIGDEIMEMEEEDEEDED